MEETKALTLFLQKEVKEAMSAFVVGSMWHLKKENREEIEQKFLQDFQTLFHQCKEHKRRAKLSFVQISLMRGRALMGEPFYRLEAYDDQLYLSEPMVSLELDLWWLYKEYGKLCETIDQKSKRYIQALQEPELRRIKLAGLIHAEKIIRFLATNMLVYLLNMDDFQQLQVKDGFQVQLGEYRGRHSCLMEVTEEIKRLGRLWHGLL